MVRNIVIVLILAVIAVPSWQIGGILLERKQVRYMLQEHTNSIKRYQNEDVVKENIKNDLKARGLPVVFTFERIDVRQAKVRYTYRGAASVFKYTYYETAEPMEFATEHGGFEER